MVVKNGYKQTDIGIIPEDWEVGTFESVTPKNAKFGIVDGPFGSNLKTIHYRKSGIPIITSGYVTEGRFEAKEYLYVDQEKFRQEKRSTVRPGDIVMAKIGARCGASAILPESHEIGILSGNALKITVDNTQHSTYYIWQVLWDLYSNGNIEALRSVGAQPAISMPNLKTFRIPLPKLLEQQAIATALSDADALLAALDALIAKKRLVKQGAMQELLTGKKRLSEFDKKQGYKQTELGIIPEDWNVISAFDACSKIQDGTHFSPKTGGNDYLYITSKNIRFGYLDLSTAGWIDAVQHNAIYQRCDVKKGDLLLTKDGANTGNAALNTLDDEFSLLSSVAFLRFNPSKHSAAYFLQQVLTSEGQHQIQDAMSGNAITRLTLEKINKLHFPVPPTLAEQTAIAETLSEMDAEIVALEARREKTRLLKEGMMQELLTGRIRLI